MSQELYVILAVFGGLNLAALLFLLFHRIKKEREYERISHYGDFAENLVASYLEKNFPEGVCLNDLYFKTPHGLTQIDHILICKHGLFIIETKSHNGFIEIRERQWTQKYNDKIVKFHNPLHQNEIHIKALRGVMANERSFKDLNINGFVVFTSKNVTFSSEERGVVRLTKLAPAIRRMKPYRFDARRQYNRDKSDPMNGLLTKSAISRLEKLIIKKSEKSKLKHRRQSSKLRNYKRT